MTDKANVWVTNHEDGGWAVKTEGAERAHRVTETQAEAIEIGKELAQNKQVDLIIQGQDGQIRDRMSYGNDPYPPEG